MALSLFDFQTAWYLPWKPLSIMGEHFVISCFSPSICHFFLFSLTLLPSHYFLRPLARKRISLREISWHEQTVSWPVIWRVISLCSSSITLGIPCISSLTAQCSTAQTSQPWTEIRKCFFQSQSSHQLPCVHELFILSYRQKRKSGNKTDKKDKHLSIFLFSGMHSSWEWLQTESCRQHSIQLRTGI